MRRVTVRFSPWSRRDRFALGVALGTMTIAALLTALLIPAPGSGPHSAQPQPVPATIATEATQIVEHVASRLPVVTPDPVAACQRDPAHLPPPDGGTTFHTCGERILGADGLPAQITGVSWFGMETV